MSAASDWLRQAVWRDMTPEQRGRVGAYEIKSHFIALYWRQRFGVAVPVLPDAPEKGDVSHDGERDTGAGAARQKRGA